MAPIVVAVAVAVVVVVVVVAVVGVRNDFQNEFRPAVGYDQSAPGGVRPGPASSKTSAPFPPPLPPPFNPIY